MFIIIVLHDVQESEQPRAEWMDFFYRINSAKPADTNSDLKKPSSTTAEPRRETAQTPSPITQISLPITSMQVGKWDTEFEASSGVNPSLLETLRLMHLALTEVVAYLPGLYRDIESQANMATAEYASLAQKFSELWEVIGSAGDTQFWAADKSILTLLDDIVGQQSTAPTEAALHAVRQVAEDARSTADGLIVQTMALGERNKRICMFLQKLKERVLELRNTELTGIEQRLSTAKGILRTGHPGT